MCHSKHHQCPSFLLLLLLLKRLKRKFMFVLYVNFALFYFGVVHFLLKQKRKLHVGHKSKTRSRQNIEIGHSSCVVTVLHIAWCPRGFGWRNFGLIIISFRYYREFLQLNIKVVLKRREGERKETLFACENVFGLVLTERCLGSIRSLHALIITNWHMEILILLICYVWSIFAFKKQYQYILDISIIFCSDYWGHPWHSGSTLDCWSTGIAIDPAPEASFIIKLILLAQVVPSPV